MIRYFNAQDIGEFLLDAQNRREAGESVKVYLAEGDSWFSIGGGTANLLMALDSPDVYIVSCAFPGDTIAEMLKSNDAFQHTLSPRFGFDWDAVLLSAGGNDLLQNVQEVLVGKYLDVSKLHDKLGEIHLNYSQMIGMVREYHDCPIYAHTYDYPVPDLAGGWFRAGPWVGDKFAEAGIGRDEGTFILHQIIDEFALMLRWKLDLVVQDTRGTLQPGVWKRFGWQKHWRNEIHPTVAGYRLLANRWVL